MSTTKTITGVYKQTKGNRHTGKVESRHVVKLEQTDSGSKSDAEVLREFDLTLEFGPCIGVSRLERWQRAEKHGLNPPPYVRDLLLKHALDDSYTQSLWSKYNI